MSMEEIFKGLQQSIDQLGTKIESQGAHLETQIHSLGSRIEKVESSMQDIDESVERKLTSSQRGDVKQGKKPMIGESP